MKRERNDVSYDLNVLEHYNLAACARRVGERHKFSDYQQACLATDLYRALCCKKHVGKQREMELSVPAIVDEAWHEFILNTDMYADFSKEFGFFCSHTTFSADDSPHLIEQRIANTIQVAEELGFYFEGNWWPEHKEKTFQIFVKGLDGKTYTFEVCSNMNVLELKHMIKQKMDVCVQKQRLCYAGKTLDDNRTLGDFGVQTQCTLHLVLKITGC